MATGIYHHKSIFFGRLNVYATMRIASLICIFLFRIEAGSQTHKFHTPQKKDSLVDKEINIKQTLFIWPIKAMPSYSEVTDFYTTNNYVDQDNTMGGKDWNCGDKTYIGHRGVDIDLWPFSWSMMNNNYVTVIAAADGRIATVDVRNNNETNCLDNQPGSWNYIAIRHDDSSTSIYGHIRDNSAMVMEGQRVVQSQPIAYVGSSGSSSHPHLHFEVNSRAVFDSESAGLIDPYTGNCNTLNSTTWWANQKTYSEPGVVRVMTHYGVPALLNDAGPANFCQAGEVKKDKASFNSGDSIYTGIAVKDISQNQTVSSTVFYPDGGVCFSDVVAAPNNFQKWYISVPHKLPAGSPVGTYKVSASYSGKTGVHFFTVGCPATQPVNGNITGYEGFIASSLISATAQVQNGARLRMQSAGTIRLLPGFKALSGCVMKARIKDCNYIE